MKKYFISLIFILISIIGWASSAIIGSRVTEGGILIEPFFLIPLSWLSLFVGIIWGTITLVKNNKFNN